MSDRAAAAVRGIVRDYGRTVNDPLRVEGLLRDLAGINLTHLTTRGGRGDVRRVAEARARRGALSG